jgi:hypothetical protein
MKGKSPDYHELEFAVQSKLGEQKTATLVAKLDRIWRGLIESIIAVNELKIYSLKSRSGSAYWALHDQISGRRVFFASEQEVRAWLDRRYYQ